MSTLSIDLRQGGHPGGSIHTAEVSRCAMDNPNSNARQADEAAGSGLRTRGSGHPILRRNQLRSVLPMRGAGEELAWASFAPRAAKLACQ